MANILFICGKARKRSPTAADVASRLFAVETDYAGLSNDADERLNLEHIKWADTIAVMEKRQLSRLKRQYGALINGKRLVCLDVPDQYEFMQPELVALLDEKLRRTLTKAAPRHAGSSD
ncbi:MAG: phosphotyrosine protein phosphatase [Rhizobiaceae bacterium]|nr:phosphotyrosine protein phosphatase [Rhizobiaceae bacterium]